MSSHQDAAAWLAKVGLGRLAAVFEQHAIGWDVLPTLSEVDLKEIGLPLGDRKRLLAALAQLRARPGGDAPQEDVVGEAERRQVTVMFCDLVGSTALSEKLDPEDLRDIIREYQNCCSTAVDKSPGHLTKYIGDGVMVCFGYPQAREDDPARAVQTGLEIVRNVRDLNGRLLDRYGVQLQVRVGVHTGLVVAGEMGAGETRESLAVVGETPNIAARLESIAPANEVVISAATERCVSGLFAVEEIGPVRLKGITDPVKAFRVSGESDSASRFDARAQRGLTPLVGRSAELAILRERWLQAADGEMRVIVLSGEPGIGKSRTIREFRDSIDPEEHARILYYGSPYYQNSAFWPAIDQFQRAARFAAEDAADRKIEKIASILHDLKLPVSDLLPALAQFVSVPFGASSPAPEVSTQQTKRRMMEAVLSIVKAMARARPVLMVVEDAQWLDPSTLDLLHLLLEKLRDDRLMLLISARPEFAPGWDSPQVLYVNLDRLSRRERIRMVREVAGAQDIAESIVQRICERADGIPLFLEEMTKAVLESGWAGERPGRDLPEETVAIPETLQDSLMARLDRLAPAKEVAQVAAAIGREFTLELLLNVSRRSEGALRDALSMLSASGLIFRLGGSGEDRFAFKHALVQDAAYNSMLLSRRRALHAQIATTMRDRLPHLADTEPETLARHFAEAGLHREAAAYWLRAGQRALQRSNLNEAIEHLTAGLGVLSLLQQDEDRLRMELNFQASLGHAWALAKGYASPQAEQTHRRAYDLFNRVEDTPDLFPVLTGVMAYHLARGQLQNALDVATRKLNLAERHRAEDLTLCALTLRGSILWHIGRNLEADEHLAACLRVYHPEKHASLTRIIGHDFGVFALAHRACVKLSLGEASQSLKMAEDATKLARELGYPFSLALALAIGSTCHVWLREARVALDWADECIAICTEQGFPHWGVMAMISRGAALGGCGRVEEGVRVMREGIAHWTESGAALALGSHLTLLADLELRARRPLQALGCADEALKSAELNGERQFEPAARCARADALASLGRLQDAETEYAAASEAADADGGKIWRLRAGIGLARLLREQGRTGEAFETLNSVYGDFTEGHEIAALRDARSLLDELR